MRFSRHKIKFDTNRYDYNTLHYIFAVVSYFSGQTVGQDILHLPQM